MLQNAVFTTFRRDNSSLSLHLGRQYQLPLMRQINDFTIEDLVETDSVLVERLIAEVRPKAPSLGGARQAGVEKGQDRPTANPGESQPTMRRHIAVQVIGDARLLEYWPDRSGADLEPVDARFPDPFFDSPRSWSPDPEKAMQLYQYLLARERWFLGAWGDGVEQALYTFEELTADDDEAVARGDLDPRAAFDGRRASVVPIVQAIASDVDHFFDIELLDVLSQAVERRRHRLAVLAAVENNLNWPDGWKFEPPKLEVPPVPSDVCGPATEVELALPLGSRRRLDPAAFADVVSTIRVWVDAVERHPAAWRSLGEDWLSDLLVATLNAALPGAQREVYSRGGKSDIFIRADVLAEGASAARIFICESKIWDGPARASEALDQLLGYLEAKDTSAVLLFFRRKSSGEAVRKALVKVLTARGDHAGSGGSLSGWPVERFTNQEGAIVDVCLAVIDLPPP